MTKTNERGHDQDKAQSELVHLFHNIGVCSREGGGDDKNMFYKRLEHLIETLPKNGIWLILGDFSEKIGKKSRSISAI